MHELFRTEEASPVGRPQAQDCVSFATVAEDSHPNDDLQRWRHHEKCIHSVMLDNRNHYGTPSADGMDIADRKSIGLSKYRLNHR
jgi:hypothetical protein